MPHEYRCIADTAKCTLHEHTHHLLDNWLKMSPGVRAPAAHRQRLLLLLARLVRRGVALAILPQHGVDVLKGQVEVLAPLCACTDTPQLGHALLACVLPSACSSCCSDTDTDAQGKHSGTGLFAQAQALDSEGRYVSKSHNTECDSPVRTTLPDTKMRSTTLGSFMR